MSTTSVQALGPIAPTDETTSESVPTGRSTSTQSSTPASSPNDHRKPMGIRLPRDTRERASYWATRRGFSSTNEYIVHALEEQIRRENLDYDLPTLEIARINQLTDETKTLSTNVANLERVITSSLDSLIGLTRGDNYLLDSEDGELT